MDQESDDVVSVSSSNYDKYLRLATDKNPSILLELDLQGNVKHLSRVWNSVVGTNRTLILGKPIANIILGSDSDKQVFQRALNMMLCDDNSYRVKFLTETGDMMQDRESMVLSSSSSSSSRSSTSSASSLTAKEDVVMDYWHGNGETIELEAQGILVHDTHTQTPSHTMWIIKPFYDIDELDNLPYDLVKKLGFGAKIFSQYLQKIEDLMILDEADLPYPNFELCRVCENMVPTWWLETHSQICVCEHRLENVVQLNHDDLLEHKRLLHLIIASLENQGEPMIREYKNIPLPTISNRNVSPLTSKSDLSLPQQSAFGSESKSQKSTLLQNLRFPFKSLYMLEELCEDAISINPSELKNQNQHYYDQSILNPVVSFYQFSPNTESHIENVLTWRSSFEISDPAINLLTQDTIELCKSKVESVLRMDNTLKYSLKVKNEVDLSISQLIKERIQSNRINASYNLDMAPNINSVSPSGRECLSDLSDAHPKIATPLPQRLLNSNNLFSQSYMGTDNIPEPNSSNDSNIDKSISRSNLDLSQSNSAQISKSVTPKQIFPEPSTSTVSIHDVLEHNPNATLESGSNPSTPKFGLNNYLHLPKLTSSISLTPRRGSPVNFSTPAAGQQRVNNGMASNCSSTNIAGILPGPRSVNDNSPMISPFIIGSDGLPSSDLQQRNQPLSPLLLPTTGKPIVPSIKDYEVIKPISKGAYGSVYLAKKRVTGEYFAIKVLKKSDMIAKNQVTNVKSERAIMMVQSDKPYVAKLYATFQNKENLFLVMEYLSGGDMATLIKMMGTLPDGWARQYICEVISGVEDMHQNGIIHHDLKPDNLLIDSQGHIKLTDFGLSRMGLLRRHKEKRSLQQNSASRKPSVPSEESSSRKNSGSDSTTWHTGSGNLLDLIKKTERSQSTSSSQSQSTGYDVPYLKRSGSHVSFSVLGISRSGTPPPSSSSVSTSEHLGIPSQTQGIYQHHSRTNSTLSEAISMDCPKDLSLFNPDEAKNFFGTPDYLAPETIMGTGESVTCDWWSVGCIFFEFLFGYPPFHAATVDDVFHNILNGSINWPTFPDEETEFEYISPDAKDLILKLLVLDPEKRLGARGSAEIKEHPYFKGVDWSHVYKEQPSFVPRVEHPEDTEYFELRGASLDEFCSSNYGEDKDYNMLDTPSNIRNIDMQLQRRLSNHSSGRNTPKQRLSIGSVLEMVSNGESTSANGSPTTKHIPLSIPPHMRDRRGSKLNDTSAAEFGSFNYRNLNALDKANKDAISRLKTEHLSEFSHQRTSNSSLSSSSSESPNKLKLSANNSPQALGAVSVGSRRSHSPQIVKWNTSSPSRRNSIDTMSPQLSASKRFSEVANCLVDENAAGSSSNSSPLASKFKSPLSPPSIGSNPGSVSKTRKTSRNSFSSTTDDDERMSALSKINTVRKLRRRSGRKSSSNTNDISYRLDVLLCEPIPIHRYRVTEDLESIGCSVVAVGAGDEMVRRATTGVKFDLIITAMKLPKLGAVDIAKLIRHTNSINCSTPIVALTVYYQDAKAAKVFDDVLEKPVNVEQLRKLISKYALLKSQSEEDTLLSDTDY